MNNSTPWTAENIPDQTGKIIIVTGANSGIGYDTARLLAEKGAQVVMACRNVTKSQAALEKLRGVVPNAQVTLMQLDLASLDSVQAFANAFRARFDKLDVLINNAGVMALSERRETADGFEMQFGTNHLGHFALTGLLIDMLLVAPGARIVNVSSGAHRMGRVEFDNLNAEQSYGPWSAYGLSKLANLLFTYELQRRLSALGSDVIATAAHPGYTNTNLQQHSSLFSFLNPLLAQSSPTGALPTVRAAVDPDAQGGDYYGPGGMFEMRGYPVKVEPNEASHNPVVAKRLWEVSEDLTGIHFDALDSVNAGESAG